MSVFISVGVLHSEGPGTELTCPLYSVHTALSRLLFYGRLLVVFSQTSLLQFAWSVMSTKDVLAVWFWEDCCFSDIYILCALVKASQSVFSLSIEKVNLS